MRVADRSARSARAVVAAVLMVAGVTMAACSDGEASDSTDVSAADTVDASSADAAAIADAHSISPDSVAGDVGADAGHKNLDAGPSLLSWSRCADNKRVGGWAVQPLPSYTTINGQVFSGVQPHALTKVTAQEGGCRLLAPDLPQCDTPCGAEQSCGAGDKCVPTPRAQDFGEVTIDGLSGAVLMKPTPPVQYYNFVGKLPLPPYASGAIIELKAAGKGKIGALALKAQGVAPLSTALTVVDVSKDQPAALTWQAPPSGHNSRVAITLNIDQHGTSGGRVRCEAEDTGKFAVPASLVTKLLDVGYSGFPSVRVRRISAQAAETSVGCVEFAVRSDVTLPVRIDGLTSCSDNSDCPKGQSCKGDLTCG